MSRFAARFKGILGSAGRQDRTSSATEARDRLKIILSHERGSHGHFAQERVERIRKDILAVIQKHAVFDTENLDVRLNPSLENPNESQLEIIINLSEDDLAESESLHLA